MTDPNDFRTLLARLDEERARLDRVRADYERITRSRFHALRMLWFSFKQLVGASSPHDMYAVWSPGLALHLPPRKKQAADSALLSLQEQALVERWNARVQGAPASEPVVSVVIPVFNHRETTVNCLQSIAETWFDSLAVQFIVVDDGSSDNTAAVLTKMHGVDYLRNGSNQGYIHACNRGAALARGRYMCFLNNDTIVQGGWLDRLVSTAEADPSIGVVGAKLLFPDGRLQEAGGVIWRDASGWNVGRGQDASDPRYNYVRDVDYVSGAALLVRTDLFFATKRFDERFAPAYYEDTDLCFKVREVGKRVVYQPRSVVVHYDGVTSGNERTGIKRYQEINRHKFREKWAAALEKHYPNSPANVEAASLPNKAGKTVLVIDTYVPMYDKESGSHRMFYIVRMLREEGYNVVFLPDNFSTLQPYTEELQQMGIQVLYEADGSRTMDQALRETLPIVDIAWISRPNLFQKYAGKVRRHGNCRLIYDTVDLHFIRKQREADVRGDDDSESQRLQTAEIEAARTADATVVVTREEKDALLRLGVNDVFVVPNIHEPANLPRRRFEDTSGLLFIGNYNHPPNVDAAQWLCESVMPIVWKSLPDLIVTFVGSNPNDDLRALQSDRVKITGYVRDVSLYFRKNRLFVAPLRFGAGMKGKIGQAFEYGLPVVTTPVGAEGFDLRDGETAVIAEAAPQAFAAAIVGLYGDKARWHHIGEASKLLVDAFTRQAVLPQLQAVLRAKERVPA